MKSVSVALLGLLFGSSLPGANPAAAADVPDVIPAYAPSWSWTGFYLGAHLGAGSASSQFSDPRGPSIYGGTVRSPAFLGGGQGGYNWQISNFVLTGCPCQTLPVRTERYGGFIQASYKLDGLK